jgi:hypothetical protein
VSIPTLHMHVWHLQGQATSTPTSFGGTIQGRTRAASGSPLPPAGRDPGWKKVCLDLSSPVAPLGLEASSSEAWGVTQIELPLPLLPGSLRRILGPMPWWALHPHLHGVKLLLQWLHRPLLHPAGPDSRHPHLLDQAWVQELQRALGILLAPPCRLHLWCRDCCTILRICQSGWETQVITQTLASPLTKFSGILPLPRQ